MLLPRAHISTVHGFCAGLLREHFQELELSPRFRVGEEAEIALLREEAVSEVLEALYGEKDPAFLQLAELMGTGRDDRRLTAAVRRLYDFIQSHPYPDQWLEEKQALFAVEGPVGETSWGRLVRRQMEQTLLACVALLDKARELADGEEKMAAAYGSVLRADRTAVAEAAKAASSQEDWDALRQRLLALPAPLGGWARCANMGIRTGRTG